MVRGQPLVALGQAVKQSAKVDVDLGGSFDPASHRLERIGQSSRERVLQVRRERFAGEFILNRDGGLLAPDRKFLALC